MEDLYDELWQKKTSVVRDFIVEVPQPQPGIEPGYGIGPKEAAEGGLPLLELQKNIKRQTFKRVEINARLPCHTGKFLVRPEYDEVKTLLEDAVLEKWSGPSGPVDDGASLDYHVSFQPGSGKLYFLSYLLVTRLLMGQPTVYRLSDHSCFLFDQETPGLKIDLETLFSLGNEKKRQLWVLTEEELQDEGWSRRWSDWFVVLVALPAIGKASWEWKKNRNVAVHNMWNWKWEEIFAAFSLHKPERPTCTEIERLYTTYAFFGPIASTCLTSIPVKSDQAYALGVEACTRDLDGAILALCRPGNYLHILHRLNQPYAGGVSILEPNLDKFSYQRRIATRWIAHRVFNIACEQSSRVCLQLYHDLSEQPSPQDSRAWCFEAFAQNVFSQGGSFIAQRLPMKDSSSPPLEFEILKTTSFSNYFTSTEDLVKQVRTEDGSGILTSAIGKYFLPSTHKSEFVDGLVFSKVDTLNLLRITTAKRLALEQGQIIDLTRSLPETIHYLHIIFVVPPDATEHHSNLDELLKAFTFSQIPSSITITQFQFVLRNRDIKLVAVD